MGCGKACAAGTCLGNLSEVGVASRDGLPYLPEGGPGWTWRDWEGPGGSFQGGAEDRLVLTVASVLLKFPGG